MPTPSFIGSQQHSQQTLPKTLVSALITDYPLSLFEAIISPPRENWDTHTLRKKRIKRKKDLILWQWKFRSAPLLKLPRPPAGQTPLPRSL